jgi:uncharacterized protein YyaL (SSP411 family)
MLNSIYLYVKKPVEVTVIITDNISNTNNSNLAAWLNRQFLPHTIIGIVHPNELAKLERYPYFKGREAQGGQETAFVCKNYTCSLPIKSIEELESQLMPS